MEIIIGIFTALANIKSIAGYVETFAGAVTYWYVSRQKAETLAGIADAAALAARAETDDQRYEAAAAWQKALSRPRSST